MHLEHLGLATLELGGIEHHFGILADVLQSGPYLEVDLLVATGSDELFHGGFAHGNFLLVAVAIEPEAAQVGLLAFVGKEALEFASRCLDEDIALQGGAEFVVGRHVGTVLGIEETALTGFVLGVHARHTALQEPIRYEVPEGSLPGLFPFHVLVQQPLFDGFGCRSGHDEPEGIYAILDY